MKRIVTLLGFVFWITSIGFCQSSQSIHLRDVIRMAMDSSTTENVVVKNKTIISVVNEDGWDTNNVDWDSIRQQNQHIKLHRDIIFERCVGKMISLENIATDTIKFVNSQIDFIDLSSSTINRLFITDSKV